MYVIIVLHPPHCFVIRRHKMASVFVTLELIRDGNATDYTYMLLLSPGDTNVEVHAQRFIEQSLKIRDFTIEWEGSRFPVEYFNHFIKSHVGEPITEPIVHTGLKFTIVGGTLAENVPEDSPPPTFGAGGAGGETSPTESTERRVYPGNNAIQIACCMKYLTFEYDQGHDVWKPVTSANQKKKESNGILWKSLIPKVIKEIKAMGRTTGVGFYLDAEATEKIKRWIKNTRSIPNARRLQFDPAQDDEFKKDWDSPIDKQRWNVHYKELRIRRVGEEQTDATTDPPALPAPDELRTWRPGTELAMVVHPHQRTLEIPAGATIGELEISAPQIDAEVRVNNATVRENTVRTPTATAGGRPTDKPGKGGIPKEAQKLVDAINTWLTTGESNEDKMECKKLCDEYHENKASLTGPSKRADRVALITEIAKLAGLLDVYDKLGSRSQGFVFKGLEVLLYPSAVPAAAAAADDDGADAPVVPAAPAADDDGADVPAAAAADDDDADDDGDDADDDDESMDDTVPPCVTSPRTKAMPRKSSERSPNNPEYTKPKTTPRFSANDQGQQLFSNSNSKKREMDDDTAKQTSSEGTHRPSGRRRSSRLSGHNFFVMKNTPQFKEMRYKPGDKHNQWHVYGFFFHTDLGSTTECAADEVSFEDAWGKRDHGGASWFRCDDTNIWPPDGG